MSKRTAAEVLVVGAGPVGLYTALSLVRKGVKPAIVDTGLWPCTHSFGLALHPQTLELFRESGLLDAVAALAYPVRTIGFWDAEERKATVRPGTNGGPADHVAVVRQDELERLLEQALEAQGVRVLWRHEACGFRTTAGTVTASLQRYEQESRGYAVEHSEWIVAETVQREVPYVVGADGHGSIVRRSAQIEFPEIEDARYYAVFEFESDFDAQHEVRVVFSDTAADVLWPLPGGRCRWSFELPEHMEPADKEFRGFMAVTGADLPSEREKDRSLKARPATSPLLTEDHLRELIAERAPWFDARIGPLSWRTVVRFERRMAQAYGSGRMWLAGDAAHLAAPIAVQSLNAGLAEAEDLAGTLARVIKGQENESVLCGYGEKWTAVWRQLHGLERPLQPGPAASPWTAAHARRFLPCLPAYGEGLSRLAAQLGLEI